MSASHHPIFIVGCPRSGTTLLGVLLDRHSRICITPETAFFDEVAPQLAAAPTQLPEVLRAWPRLPELRLTPEQVLARLGRQHPTPGLVLAGILELYAEAEGKPRCGEKTPQHLRHVPALLESFPGATILCMVRDGTETALSLSAMPWWPPRTLADAAELWLESRRLAERFAQLYPARFKRVRYETLVASPVDRMSTLMPELGEPFEPTQLDPQTPSHLVLPRSLAWKGRALEPVARAEPGQRRRDHATRQQLAVLEQLLGVESAEPAG